MSAPPPGSPDPTPRRPALPPPGLLLLVAGGAQRALARGPVPPGTPRKLVALVTGAASVGLLAASGLRFRGVGTTVDPLDPGRARALVTDGVNSVTRNPMYVGMAGLLVAHGLWRGSWASCLPAAAFVAAIDRLQVPAEEVALTERFGAEYTTYRGRVPRWIGLPRRARVEP